MTSTRRASALGAVSNNTANTRASLGGAVRQAQKTPSKARASTGGRKSILGGRASMAGGGRKSMLAAKSPMVKPRSSSIYSGRGSAAFMEGPKKDTRPIKDKHWQAEKSSELIEFLIAANYNHHISPKILQNPTRKDFECIFQFLYKLMDPHFEFSNKFEDDAIMIFKRLRYPFEVKKSALFAVGSAQWWPSLLAALNWLVELIKYHFESQNEEPIDFSSADDIMGDDGEKLTYQYLQKAYRDFLSGVDEESVETFFGPFYAEKERCLTDEVTKLKEECGALETRLAAMQEVDSPLLQTQKKRDELQSDLKKFEQYIAQLEERLAYFQKLKGELGEELTKKTADLAGLEAEKANLLEQITSQPVSAVEVQEMNIKRDAISEQIRSVELQRSKINEGIVEGEKQVTRMSEEITAVCFNFNSRAAELQLAESFQLAMNPTWQTTNQVTNVDLKKTMQGLSELKGEYNRQVHALKEEKITLSDQASQAADEVLEKKSHLTTMEEGIRTIEAEVDTMHGEDAELEELVAEKKQIEKEMANAKADHAEQVSRLQFSVDTIKAEYDEKKQAFAAEQNAMWKKVGQAMDMISQHKEYIHSSLCAVEMNTTQVHAALQKAN